ncbi:hypothetical protein [Flavobacterium sp.]|uniref:hypothetical protein n=1 Tax=Flavobacterium sp. TaxID=239 RepID=UPI0039E57CCD
MNRTQNSHNATAAQDKSSKTFFRLLRDIFAAKMAVPFDTFTVHQEKLPIIYANIRV